MGAELSVANLDGYLIKYISSFFWGFELVPLRATCRRLRRAIASPKRMTPKQLFKYAIKHDSIPLLRVAKENHRYTASSTKCGRLIGKYNSNAVWTVLEKWGIEIESPDYCYGAAEGHRNEWCKKPYDIDISHCHWYCKQQMFSGAAAGGNLSLLQWLFATDYKSLDDIQDALYDAAAHNQLEACKYLKEVGRLTTFDGMLVEAASKGHIDICRLAEEWGIRAELPLNLMLKDAICRNSIFEYIWVLDHRGVSIFESPLHCVSKRTSKELCSVLLKYTSMRFSDGFTMGTDPENELICEMLLQAISSEKKQIFLEHLLQYAAWNNFNRLCHMAKHWGACDFDSMLEEAVTHRHADREYAESVYLAIEWLAKTG